MVHNKMYAVALIQDVMNIILYTIIKNDSLILAVYHEKICAHWFVIWVSI